MKSAGGCWACIAIEAPTTAATSDARRIGLTFSPPLPGCRRAGCVEEHLAAHHRQHRLDLLDLIGGDRQVIAIDDHEVGEPPFLDRAEVVFTEEEERIAARVRNQRLFPR